jgi:hypothetical protein
VDLSWEQRFLAARDAIAEHIYTVDQLIPARAYEGNDAAVRDLEKKREGLSLALSFMADETREGAPRA